MQVVLNDVKIRFDINYTGDILTGMLAVTSLSFYVYGKFDSGAHQRYRQKLGIPATPQSRLPSTRRRRYAQLVMAHGLVTRIADDSEDWHRFRQVILGKYFDKIVTSSLVLRTAAMY